MREQGAERLMNLMTQLPDELLNEAIAYEKPAPRTVSWNKGVLVAACLCVCLIGGLAWSSTLGELGEETGAAGSTGAGVTAGGAAGGAEVKPTLASSTEQTGARPVDSTDETPMASTDVMGESSSSGIGMMVSEFWHKGRLYVDTGVLLEELPAGFVAYGLLSGSNMAAETEWVTRDPALIGARVYGAEGDDSGFYVETEGGYRYYGKGVSADE